jgi:serine phosphatase RsbU (regulator of sigma subunit)
MVVLLVEDDSGDAFIVKELLAESGEAGAGIELRWARSIAEAGTMLRPDVRCVLLDLGLPDAEGMSGLQQVLAMAPHVAVIVLTGFADAPRGVAAVATGAQDYLIKHEVDGPLLARSIRYAVERKRADESQRRLFASELRAEENTRLQRGLLPTPLLDGTSLAFTAQYRPGRQRALLGGDFYDAVQRPDGSVHVMIGDVCGHGPDEAALGVCLRIAWRTLVLAGRSGQELLTVLDEVLVHERRSEELFATLCTVEITPARDRARVFCAGHPMPLLLDADGVRVTAEDDAAGPALGLGPGFDWPAADVALADRWSLLLFTDGLVEGRVGDTPERLGVERLMELIITHLDAGHPVRSLVEHTIAEVESLNGGPLTDDLAVLLLSRDGAAVSEDSRAAGRPEGVQGGVQADVQGDGAPAGREAAAVRGVPSDVPAPAPAGGLSGGLSGGACS